MKMIKNMMVGIVVIYLVTTLLFLSGCSIFKAAGRTINDAATILCEIVATDQIDQLNGMTTKEWCAIQKNLAPFIDEILSAREEAELKLGFKRED